MKGFICFLIGDVTRFSGYRTFSVLDYSITIDQTGCDEIKSAIGKILNFQVIIPSL